MTGSQHGIRVLELATRIFGPATADYLGEFGAEVVKIEPPGGDPAVFPYTYIRCRDGHTFIAAYNDEAFESLMHIIGRPELSGDPRFRTGTDRTRIENEKALHAILEEWSGTRTADEILREIEEYTSKKSGHGTAVVTGRVNRPCETLSEENWWERGCFSRISDPVYGDLLLAAPPWKMSGTPPRIRSVCRPPGADNEEVYSARLGMGGGRRYGPFVRAASCKYRYGKKITPWGNGGSPRGL